VTDILQTRVIPVLLLMEKGLVKTVQFSNPAYIGDPINAVHIFNDKEVDELIFLDITPVKRLNNPAADESYHTPLDLIRRISEECSMPLAFGGGIRTVEDVRNILATGVEKVVINTSAISNPDLIRTASDTFGSQSVVVSMDVKRLNAHQFEVHSHGGSKPTGIDPVHHARSVVHMGAGEIMVTGIDNDGMMSGYDLDLISLVCGAVTVPVIACGGAGTLQHFTDGLGAGASAVAAGSMFVFHGRRRAVLISYPERWDIDQALSHGAVPP
jgi:cyclase